MRVRFILACLVLSFLAACSSTNVRSGETTTVVLREPINELERDPVPGTVNDVWIEPMHTTVRVPGQIDPSGTYYRKGHRTLAEIRYGRYQKVEYPKDRAPTIPTK